MDLDFDEQPSDHGVRAGARFKPKGRPQPKKKQVSLSTSETTLAKEKLSKQSEDPASPSKSSTFETIVPESEIIDQSKGVNWSMKPSILRACTNVDFEGKRSEPPANLDDPETQRSTTFGDFVTPVTDGDIHVETERIQTGEEEYHLDMETLDIVQDEGITTSAYEQHTGKFQPKPRLLETVIEEPQSHYSVDDTNQSEFVESTNGFNTNTTFYEEVQEEEHIRETVPEMEARWEHEEQVVSPNTVIREEERSGRESKTRKPKEPTTRKRKTLNEEEQSKTNENPKFKRSSRRQKRTLEKELLETPDDEIRFLPIRDMLRLVEYKEWVEKKEAKGAVAPPVQESSNMNESDNQYRSQDFGEEDEFGMEESENQESNVVKPDSPVNYQTYMNKSSRTRWSKQDTELFYEGIREFGSNLSMVQQLFPDRTRQQIKLKFKSEERRNPLKLNDALSSRSKHLTHFQNVIKKLQQEAAAAREGEEGEEEEEDEAGVETETTTDVPENEEPAKSEETEQAGDGVTGVKESDGGDECDDEGDDDFWNSYKSEM